MPTDQELVLGSKDNFATRTTFIVASKPEPGGEFREFNGYPVPTILHVTPTVVVGQRPIEQTDGVTGVACMGGAGVRGLGSQNRVDRLGAGTGGIGVVGHGGTGDLEGNDDPQFGMNRKTYDPGIGVLGLGGAWTGPQTASYLAPENRLDRDARGAPGVVGLAGGEFGASPMPSFEESRGVGVYGKSSDGPGMVAVGAPGTGFPGLRATGNMGVIGIGTADEGVRGTGPTGMGAYGTNVGIVAEGGIGIRALGRGAPAGVFRRTFEEVIQAQVHIEPLPMSVPEPEDAKTVKVLPPDRVLLPRPGKAGDLLMTTHQLIQDGRDVQPRPEAMLWLCVVSSSEEEAAVWKQVLLGPSIEGKFTGGKE
jgi:hypothetical protein